MRHLRANTQVKVVIGPVVAVGDGFTPVTTLDLSTADEAEIMKHDAAAVTSISAATFAAISSMDGYYNLTLTTSHTDTEGLLVVGINDDSLCLPVMAAFMVLSEAAWDSLYVAKDDGWMDVNVKTIGRADTQETEASNLEAACAAYSATRGLSGTALPAAAADAAGGLIISDAGGLDADAQLVTKINSILEDTGTTLDARIPAALVNSRMDCTIDGTGMESGAVDSILNRDASASTTNSTLGAIVNDWENGGRLDLIIDDILVDTAEIGAAGAGLTNINLPSQTMDIVGNITGNLSGSVGSVTGAVGSVTGSVGSVVATVSADVISLSGDTTAADNAESFFDGTGYGHVLQRTTIATLASQTSFTLTAGSADNDAYNDCVIVIQDASTAAQKAIAVVDDYTGSTKTITLRTDPAVFTMATTDIVTILADRALKPTAMNRTLDVTAGGTAGIDRNNIEAPTTTVGLSGTTIKTATDVETDTADIQSRLPTALVSGRIDASVGAYQTGLTPLQPTTAGRTLDVTAGGCAGVDLNNVEAPTTTLDLSGTTIAITQRVDVNTIKTQSVTCAAGVTVGAFVGQATAAIGVNASGHVSRVVLVDTTTTNTDMITAAGIRTAVGLASANLDTQLGDLPTAIENADALLIRNVSNVEASAAEHSLCSIVLAMLESSMSGTTWTIRKTGGTTYLTKTLTVDADADPITGVT